MQQALYIEHTTGVKNQFLFEHNGASQSGTACIPICLVATRQLYEYVIESRLLPPPNHWHAIMENGTRLWLLWKRQQGLLEETDFPSIHEILAMPQCRTFNALFGEHPTEYGGIAKNTKTIENSEGTLATLLNELQRIVTQENKNACALIILPVNSCVSLLCRRESGEGNDASTSSFFLFDPHGRPNSDECVLLQFFDARIALRYLYERYQIQSIDCLNQQERALYSAEELQSQFGYSAFLFVK